MPIEIESGNKVKSRGSLFCACTTSLALGLSVVLGAVSALAAYPDRPIRLIVPTPPGGPNDVVGRVLVNDLGPLLGVPLIIENKPGAASNIGTTFVARAEHDGYTLLISSSAITVNPAISERLAWKPADFAPISLVGDLPVVLAASGKAGINSIAELVARAKAQPNTINYSSPGVGTTPHLAGELLKMREGIGMAHVPYTGAAPAVQAAVAGDVHLTASGMPPARPQIEAGHLKGLAVTGAKRWRGLPNVPTMVELGYKDFLTDSLLAVLAPARTPPEVLKLLAERTKQVLERPDVVKRLNASGIEVTAGGPDQLAQRLTRETEFWRELAKKAGIKVKE